MKRQLLILALTGVALMNGCSVVPDKISQPAETVTVPSNEAVQKAPGSAANRVMIKDHDGLVEVQKAEMHLGVSSATVERLAQSYGCTGSTGAGLLTEKGPIEVYRVQCENGSTFIARCELRQCRSIR